MCGRYALFTDPSDLADEFDLADATYEPTYNAAPSEGLPVILDDEPETLTAARWGLVPSWSDGPGSDPDPINARAETLTGNRYFREAYRERRCLVPADGFYEWTETADGKRPHFFSRADGRPFLLAGLWETWTPEQTQTGLGEFESGDPDSDPEAIRSFTVVTTDSNDRLADYHDRMPVLFDRESGERWLTADHPSDLLGPSELDLQAWPVSRAVNDPSNDRPGLVESVA
jgi:putative SOS response-associated peptidase YedK